MNNPVTINRLTHDIIIAWLNDFIRLYSKQDKHDRTLPATPCFGTHSYCDSGCEWYWMLTIVHPNGRAKQTLTVCEEGIIGLEHYSDNANEDKNALAVSLKYCRLNLGDPKCEEQILELLKEWDEPNAPNV